MSSMATVTRLRTGDKEAVIIGKLCERARGSMVDSVKCLIEAGQKLIEKKKSLKHGEWMPWLKENKDALGFSGKNTAAKLMNAAVKFPVNGEFSEAEASQISKSVWGNKSRRPKPSPKAEKIRDVVENLLLTGEAVSRKKLSKEYKVGENTVQLAAAAARARRELLAELSVDPATLSLTAQAKLEVAKRTIERKLAADYAARARKIDDEVRERVVAENKEYVSKLNEKEQKADETIATYQEWINNRKPLFTSEQFKTILMCLHPDGKRTADKLAEAFRLFNSKKFQLTGEK